MVDQCYDKCVSFSLHAKGACQGYQVHEAFQHHLRDPGVFLLVENQRKRGQNGRPNQLKNWLDVLGGLYSDEYRLSRVFQKRLSHFQHFLGFLNKQVLLLSYGATQSLLHRTNFRNIFIYEYYYGYILASSFSCKANCFLPILV